jgi:hypothetical protein
MDRELMQILLIGAAGVVCVGVVIRVAEKVCGWFGGSGTHGPATSDNSINLGSRYATVYGKKLTSAAAMQANLQLQQAIEVLTSGSTGPVAEAAGKQISEATAVLLREAAV